jgi:hypothetical protein
MTAAVVIGSRDGHIVAIGPAAKLRPAFRGAAPLTIEDGAFQGDVVTLSGLQVWRDGDLAIDDVAETSQDPDHDELLAAYIDADALGSAPKLTAELEERQRASYEAVRARAAAADVWDRWSQSEPPA